MLSIVASTAVGVLVTASALSWLVHGVLRQPESYVGSTDLATISLIALLFASVALTMGTVIGWRLGQKLTRPVLVMADVMMAMAEGDLEARPPEADPRTELGRMAHALEFFRLNARARMEAEAGRRAAEQIAKEQSEFLAIMSHEIRTPMNGVLGMAQALQRTRLEPQQRRMLDILNRSGDNLLELLNSVLDFASIEAGRLELAVQPFDLAEIVGEVVGLFEGEARDKGLVITNELPAGPLPFEGDAQRVKQILTNLVSNAVKFTDHGHVAVSLALEAAGESQTRVALQVRDTGTGIDAALQERLFTKFVQADASSTRRHGGTGLGLAISRELARLMGGDITVQSRVAEGSVFTFQSSFRLQDTPVGLSASADPAPVSLRVLVVEDNAFNRAVIGGQLEAISAAVTFAENGAEAVAAFDRQVFDIILMDLQMPVMDGYAATREIRRREADGPRTPILAVSANASPEDRARGRTAGLDGHVAKPVKPAELFSAMNDAMTSANRPKAGQGVESA